MSFKLKGIVMDINKVFGQVLRDLRRGKGLSQESLAFECDLDRTFISLLERGLRQPSLKTLYKLAEALEMAPSDLLIEVENRLRSSS